MARFNYEVTDQLDRIVRKCLEKNRERRYQSMRDLMIDLQNLLDERAPARSNSELPADPGRAGSKIRAVIVDDEDLARQVLREYLRSEADIEVVAECGNGF